MNARGKSANYGRQNEAADAQNKKSHTCPILEDMFTFRALPYVLSWAIKAKKVASKMLTKSN